MKRADLLTITAYTSVLRIIGQIVAFISGLVISTTFGATSSTDTYYASLILPTSLANLVINILTNLFAPIYLELLHRDPIQQRPMIASLQFVTYVALLGAATVSLIAVPISISLRNIHASNTIEATIFGVTLGALTPLVGLTRLSSTICEAHGHYGLPAITALLNPLAFVAILLLTTPVLGIYSLICANLAGQTAEFLVLTIYARHRLNVPIRPSPHLHPAVREMILQSISPAITYCALIFVPIFDRTAAATLDAGSLTAFHFGERIVIVLDLIIMTSVISPISNYWAQRTAELTIDSAARTFNSVISSMLFILVPLCLSGFALRYALFSVLFHHGQFNLDMLAAKVFGLLLLSAPLNYMIVIIVRLLLIARNTRTQMILALSVSMQNTFFNFLLVPILGLPGIPLSTLLSRVIVLAMSFYFLKNQFRKINLKAILPNLARTLSCAGIMFAALFFLQTVLSPSLSRENGMPMQLFALAVTISVSSLIYIVAAYQTHHPDLSVLLKIIAENLAPRFGIPRT